ncbi:hypothetical protein JCM4814A_00640 [Streptomyces phaeofaciens JCM 4814]|uniref:Uncharacterized protein n=1 Tax=Streptomyces phaeofaciens TaxID=68254 RepID=A0A918HRH9_9ACTN|nr:hypothetical protein GCM10010226_92000 [Streptomyces phaeofaciens]
MQGLHSPGRDHPRECGEQQAYAASLGPDLGPSPRVHGEEAVFGERRRRQTTINRVGSSRLRCSERPRAATTRSANPGGYTQVNRPRPDMSDALVGSADGDFVFVGPNAGTVDGGLGSDFCRVASGNSPIDC